MSKELTLLEAYNELKSYLEDILNGTCNSNAMRHTDSFMYLMPFIKQVESALKDSEWYKNEMIKFEKAYTNETEEKIKYKLVLDVIINKQVNMCAFISWNNVVKFDYKKYLEIEYTYLISAKRLTENEFNDIKEIIREYGFR